MASIKDEHLSTLLSEKQLFDQHQFQRILEHHNEMIEDTKESKGYASKVLKSMGFQFSTKDKEIEKAFGEYFNLQHTDNGQFKIRDIDLTTMLSRLFYLKKRGASLIYFSRSGWKSLDATTFRELTVAFLSIFFSSPLPGNTVFTRVLETLKAEVAIPNVTTSNTHIQFNDCMFQIDTGETLDFQPDVIPRISFDMNFKNRSLRTHPPEQFERFIRQVVEGDVEYEAFIYHVIAYMISPLNLAHYNGTFLYGPGSNGKSVLVDLIRSFFHSSHVSNKNLASLNSRFGLSGLDTKQIILAHESSKVSPTSQALSAFKSILADGRVHIEEKGKDGRDAEVEIKAVMATNEKITFSKENINAMSRRLLILPFKNVVIESERDLDLPEKLQAEKPEIMAFLLSKMQAIAKPGFHFQMPHVVKLEHETWFSSSNTSVTNEPIIEIKVTSWINQNVEPELGSRLEVTAFANKIRESTGESVSSYIIGRVMKKTFGAEQQTSSGSRYWKGFAYKQSKIPISLKKYTQ